MEINGNLLNIEKEIEDIIINDPWTSTAINNKWVLNNSLKTPEYYEKMQFGIGEVKYDKPDFSWGIYADALKEFGVVLFTEDQITGVLHTDKTRQTVKTLVEQYGLRNVTNEFARQIRDKIGKENIERYIFNRRNY